MAHSRIWKGSAASSSVLMAARFETTFLICSSSALLSRESKTCVDVDAYDWMAGMMTGEVLLPRRESCEACEKISKG